MKCAISGALGVPMVPVDEDEDWILNIELHSVLAGMCLWGLKLEQLTYIQEKKPCVEDGKAVLPTYDLLCEREMVPYYLSRTLWVHFV